MTTSSIFRFWPLAAILAGISFSGITPSQNAFASPAKLDPPVKPAVSGKFLGNGKGAAIRFVTVGEREEFGGKEAVKLIFTEKDPANTENPDFDAFFGKFGSALILSVNYDGEIFGCEVAHSAHNKSGFS
jgi:hypothetical protein